MYRIEALKKGLKRTEDTEKFEAQPSPPVEPVSVEKNARKDQPEISAATHGISVESEKRQENGKRQRKGDAALQDPTVKYFLNTFDAQVLSVEPIKKGKK